MTRYRTSRLGCRASLLAITWATLGWSAPILRKQVDVHGDFAMFGNTLGWNCGTTLPQGAYGTVDCAGVTYGGSTDESGIDIYWSSDTPEVGQVTASGDITSANARSTAMLVLPSGAHITYARAYWAGYLTGATRTADSSILIERPGAAISQTVQAGSGETWTVGVPGFTNQYWYQSSAEVTTLLQQGGAGAYRVSGVNTYANLSNYRSNVTMAGWSVVVFYEIDGDTTTRNLALFDGLDAVGPGVTLSSNLTGFLVPQSGFKAKLGVLAYEGDNLYTGDQLLFNGTALGDAINPVKNFFNSTYSNLGVAVNNVGDLPRLGGTAGTMGGIDIDVVDVTGLVKQGDTSATIGAVANSATTGTTTAADRYVVGAFVTSISTYKPDFTTSGKTVSKVTPGALRPGSVLEYTVTAKNTGNDTSINTLMTDQLPEQVTYVPGSLAVTAIATSTPTTAVPGALSDTAYNTTTRKLTVPLDAHPGDSLVDNLEVGDSITLTFRVTLNPTAVGSINNQAVISADGNLGAPNGTFPTDGNGSDDGAPPTGIAVDSCGADAECANPTPYCDTLSSPQVCVGCLTSDQCTSAIAPECGAITHQCECPSGVQSCVDTDGDGLTDVTELLLGTDLQDADSDDDGVPDGSEYDPGVDSDGDGLINALDPDSDNDGLFDGTEMGFDCGTRDTNLGAKRCVADADLGATKTNPILADTDDGGISDGSEDSNLNGIVDNDETDPNLRADDATAVDTDKDGLSDALEIRIGSNPNDRDTDDDGVVDGAEANPTDDGDGDGLITVLDFDSDSDALFDGTEMGFGCSDRGTDVSAGRCIADADGGQSRTSPLIADTDRGGMSDGLEDRNHDGRVDWNERNPNLASDDSAKCYADIECGAVASGQVCDATHVCVNGCRGTDGNGCAQGQVCSSNNEAIGTCSNAEGAGGAPGTGGATSTGVGGDVNAGGAQNTGSTRTTGGATSTVAPETGGSSATGGAPTTGGISSTGSAATGGESEIDGGALDAGNETGGASGTGGSSSEDVGDASATGGSAVVVTVPIHNTGSSVEGGGCSCNAVGSRNPSGTWVALLAGALAFWRRRRSH
jgi:clumping factor A